MLSPLSILLRLYSSGLDLIFVNLFPRLQKSPFEALQILTVKMHIYSQLLGDRLLSWHALAAYVKRVWLFEKNKLQKNMLGHSTLQNLESIHSEQPKASEMETEIKIRVVWDYPSLKADQRTEGHAPGEAICQILQLLEKRFSNHTKLI